MTNKKQESEAALTFKNCGTVELKRNTFIGDGPMVDVQDAGTVSTSENKVISTAAYQAGQPDVAPTEHAGAKKRLIDSGIAVVAVVSVVTGLIVAAATYYFGWN